MNLSLLLQQCPACFAHLTWVVFEIGGTWSYSCFFGGILFPGFVQKQQAAFLGSFHLAISPGVSRESPHRIMAIMLDCGLEVSTFELQSRSYILSLYGLEHSLWIHSFRPTWLCQIIQVLATKAKFFQPSGYRTGDPIAKLLSAQQMFLVASTILWPSPNL